MDRRSFLAAVAALGAGCIESRRERGVVAGGAAANTTTATTTATNTTTSTQTTTATDTETQTGTETQTATSEPTPADEQIAQEHMDIAVAKLNSAVAIFAKFAGASATFGDVDARTEDFNSAVVAAPVTDAERHLSEARETATAIQLDTIEDLEATAAYLRAISTAQAHAVTALDELRTALAALYAADHGTADTATSAFGTSLSAAKSALSTARTHDDAATDSFDGLTAAQVAAKDAQLQAEFDAFDAFDAVLGDAVATSKSFAAAQTTLLVDEDYESAYSDFEVVIDDFGGVRDRFDASGLVAYLESDAAAFGCYLDAVVGAAMDYQTAALRGKNGREDRVDGWVDNAEEDLSSCTFPLGLHPDN